MQAAWPLNRRFEAHQIDARGRWSLQSLDDASFGSHIEIVFQGLEGPVAEGPMELQEIQRLSAGPRQARYVISGSLGPLPVTARALLVHETPGPGYAAALPAHAVPMAQRWLWRALLTALRIPGVFALIARLRRVGR